MEVSKDMNNVIVQRELEQLGEAFKEYGIINKPKTLEEFKSQMGLSKSNHANVKYTISSIAESDKRVMMYDKDTKETQNRELAEYIIVETDVTNKYNQFVCFAFMRVENDRFKCYYVSGIERCKDTMRPKNEEKENGNSEVADTAEQKYITSITNEIEATAMFKNVYSKSNCNAVKLTLQAQECKIAAEIRNKQKKNYIVNKAGNLIAYNTGIMDEYGSYNIIVQELLTNGVGVAKVVRSKALLIKDGFETTEIEPVKLYESIEELVFEGKSEDIDTESDLGIQHIVTEREERLPEGARGMSAKKLYDAIKASIEFDIRMNKHDFRWILPFYSHSFNEIQYLFPLYITKEYTESADAALIVRKEGDIYRLGTVLTLKQAYIDAAEISEPKCMWISMEE